MNELFKKINEVKHVQIVVEEEYLYSASALYTYVLRLHKKVSLTCASKELDVKYGCLPWFEKIKTLQTPSAELTINLNHTALELCDAFSERNVELNPKMATALYAGLLNETKGFSNAKVNVWFLLLLVS